MLSPTPASRAGRAPAGTLRRPRNLRPALRLAVVGVALVLSAGVARAQVVNIGTGVAVNTTWGPTGTVVGTVFRITSNIAINAGVTLTIQPGVIVKFNASTGITVNGRLLAQGTGGSNIYFTSVKDDAIGGDTNGDGGSTAPASQDWNGLVFPDASPDNSILDFCDVRFSGAGQQGALRFESSNHAVSNSVIRRSYFGIDCVGSAAPTITNTSIEASTQTPIVLDFTAAPVLSSLVFSSADNGYDAFGLRGATFTTGTFATLPKRGATVGVNPITNVTYVLLGALTINAGAGLTINPGVVIKPSGAHIITVNGNLTMNGTAAVGDTITITSIHDDNFGLPGDTNNNGSITAPAPGNWGRVVFNQGATGSVSRCRLKFGSSSGSQGMVEMTNNSIGVSNCLLSDAGHGLALFGVSNPAVSTVAINNCTSTPVLMSVSANPTFTSISLLANAITAIGLNGEPIAVNSQISQRTLGGFANMTYYLMNGTLNMLSPAILTIDPGIVIKNEISGGGFVIDGGLVADGTPAQPIVFTSLRDDLYGNPPDSNGDGSSTTPAVANWTNIHFTATTNDAVSKLDYCRLLYGSSSPFDGYPCTVWITSAAPAITNCVINKGQHGIRVDGNGTPLIDACDINNCSQTPILMSALADPTISTNNLFSTNGYNAIGLMSETLSQNALIKYRPGVGTPTFAYLPLGTITVANGVTLAVQPQVVLKPSSSFTLFTVNGALNIVGSNNTTGRVIITSRRDDNPIYGGDTTPNDASSAQNGDWGNIVFNDTAVDGSCVLRNVLLQFGGSGGNDGGTITTNSASPRLVWLEFFGNNTACTFTGVSTPTLDSTQVLNCTQLPIVFSLFSDPIFPHPNLITLANNTYTCLGILGETIASDALTRVRSISGIPNIAFCPTTTITVAFGAKWTIAPGVVIKLGRYATDPTGVQINIDGGLVADGKPDSLIIFTSSADDAFGGDIRGDGVATLPAAGQWGGIAFSSASNDLATVMDNCRIRYAGVFSGGSLHFTNAGPTITNTTISVCTAAGVIIDGNSTPIFTNCQIDSCTNVPVSMSLVSEPVFTNVQFLGNTYTALGVVSETLAQDVLWKIRAVSGRNNMPYLLQAGLTSGLGVNVTMQPGVIVKSTGSGSINVQRAFQAVGKTVQPESLIVFTSYRDDFYGGDTNNDGGNTVPAVSDWNYISVEGTAIDPQVVFRNCVMRYAGSGTTQGVFRCINSSPTIDSCLIANNTVGISVEGASNPRIHECSLYGNTQFAINNIGASFCVDADSCWFGHLSGPSDVSAVADLCGLGANAGSGDKVSNNVDYTPFKTSGLVNPLIGDVSLNGQVLAFDASLVMQSLVAIIVLSPLQQLVAEVDGDNLVTGVDASKILQYVAGLIPAFPAVNNLGHEVRPDALAARAPRIAERGAYQVMLGTPRREGDEWLVPVTSTGSTPVVAVELRLEGAMASTLTQITLTDAGRALHEHNTAGGVARIAIAAALPLSDGEVALLHFPATAEDWTAPRLAWARVNGSEIDLGPAETPGVPTLSFLAPPFPNPAGQTVTMRLGLAHAESGVALTVQDLAGRTIRSLHRGLMPAGDHRIPWDLADDDGRRVPPGLYFVHARAGALDATQRLIVVH